MLFVHLIYVLANYIGVFVLLAEKCRFSTPPSPPSLPASLLAFVKAEENKSISISHCWKLGVTSPKPTKLQAFTWGF